MIGYNWWGHRGAYEYPNLGRTNVVKGVSMRWCDAANSKGAVSKTESLLGEPLVEQTPSMALEGRWKVHANGYQDWTKGPDSLEYV